MPIDPLAPYGPLVETTVRVATWNVWSNYGPWPARAAHIESVLRDAAPDLVVLQEVSRSSGEDAWPSLASALGLEYEPAMEWFEPLQTESGTAILSRWPIERSDHRRVDGFDGGDGAFFQFAEVSGPRGPIDVFAAMLDWRPDLSHVRQAEVRALHAYMTEVGGRRRPTIVCCDLNATPDSDEVRMLTGKARPVAPGAVFYDAWETAGDGSPGYTWNNRNKWAALGLLPDRRIDYLLSAWPRSGGVGHPISCALLGVEEGPTGPPSDHYGVVADIRY